MLFVVKSEAWGHLYRIYVMIYIIQHSDYVKEV